MANGQPSPVLWFTGLSGAGKTTLAEAVARALARQGVAVEVLDGDEMRRHLSQGLGFSREDRNTNVARMAYVAHLLSRNGVVVLVAAISPYRDSRDRARALIGHFIEIHVATSLRVCAQRDPKGLYAKALAGELERFTGISDPYEEPGMPELRIDGEEMSVADATAVIVDKLRSSCEARGRPLTASESAHAALGSRQI